MFNALSSDELLVGVGRVLRMAADSSGPLEDYARSQLLSAYSVTRLLAAEQRGAPELLHSTRESVLAALEPDDRPAVAEARSSIGAGAAIGDVLVELLNRLPFDDDLRTGIHGALRGMVDREVELLGWTPE